MERQRVAAASRFTRPTGFGRFDQIWWPNCACNTPASHVSLFPSADLIVNSLGATQTDRRFERNKSALRRRSLEIHSNCTKSADAWLRQPSDCWNCCGHLAPDDAGGVCDTVHGQHGQPDESGVQPQRPTAHAQRHPARCDVLRCEYVWTGEGVSDGAGECGDDFHVWRPSGRIGAGGKFARGKRWWGGLCVSKRDNSIVFKWFSLHVNKNCNSPQLDYPKSIHWKMLRL